MSQGYSVFSFNGCYFLNCISDRATIAANPLDAWDVRPDDVVIVTFPKSGTYWMLKAISVLYADLNFLAPETKKAVTLDALYTIPDKLPTPYAGFVEAAKMSLRQMASPRLLYCNLPPQFFPTSWKRGDRKCKVIYITRNPKDVCVSQYVHTKAMPWYGMNFNWNEWVKVFIEGRVWTGPWLQHVVDWKKYGLQDNVLHITFEDMKMDLKSVLTNIAEFLGRPKSEEEIGRAVECCTFAEMSRGEEFYRKYAMAGGSESFAEGARHARKGVVGDWKNHFTVAQNELFDREITEKVEKNGLKLVYQM